MAIRVFCPLPASTLLWQPRPGCWKLTVCVQATFVLAPGDATLAVRQEPIHDRGTAGDEVPAQSSLVPLKSCAEVLVTGHAYAPDGAVTELEVGLRVAELHKTLLVGDDQPWFRRPLEGNGRSAFGSLELARRPAARGLSPEVIAWAALVTRGQSRGPAPPGMDYRLFNEAPVDQQLSELALPMDLELVHLHPAFPRQARAQLREGRECAEIPMRCDTLWIDADRSLAVVSWRGLADAPSGDERDAEELYVTAELPRRKLRLDRLEAFLHGRRPSPFPLDEPDDRGDGVTANADRAPPTRRSSRHATMALTALPPAAPLPFLSAPPSSAPAPRAQRTSTLTLDQSPWSAPASVLPFTSTSVPPPASPWPPSSSWGSSTAPTADSRRSSSLPSPLPFAVPEPPETLRNRDLELVRQCASIEAQRSTMPSHRPAMGGADPDPAARQGLARRCAKLLASECESGGADLLGAFDEAYLEARMRDRPPLNADAWARAVVGLERGEVDRVCIELGLAVADLMRLRRVWGRRLADPRVAADIEQHAERERFRLGARSP